MVREAYILQQREMEMMVGEELFVDEGERERIIVEEKLIDILAIIKEHEPVGAKAISEELKKRGYELSESAVRYHLRLLEERDFIKKVKQDGRILTEQGAYELKHALVGVRIGNALHFIEEKMHQTTFDLATGKGEIVVSKVRIDGGQLEEALEVMKKANERGILLSGYYRLERLDGDVVLSFTSAVTYDGVFLKSGILSYPKYSGVLELRNGVPLRFTHVMGYENTSMSHLDFLLGQDIIRTAPVLETGTGQIYATYREIPAIALEDALAVIQELKKHGFWGLIRLSRPGKNTLLGIPVGQNRVGIVIAGSLSLVTAFNQHGVKVKGDVAWAMGSVEEMETL